MRMTQGFDLKLITHKRKIPAKSHNEILDILDNLVLYDPLVYILNISSSKLFHVDKIEQILIFECHYGPTSQFGRRQLFHKIIGQCPSIAINTFPHQPL